MFGGLLKMRPANLKLIDSGSAALLSRLVAENFRPQAKRYALAAVFMFLAAWATAAWAWLQKDLVNEIFFQHNTSMLLPLTLGIILLPLLKGIAGYGEDVILSRISNRIVADVQRRVYSHVLSFGLDFFTARPSSELIVRISGGANAARDVLNLLVLSIGRDFLTLVALVAVMVVQAPILFLVAAIIAPLLIFGLTRIVKRVRHFMTLEFLLATRIVQLLQETSQGARVVKAFSLGDYMRRQMNEATVAIEARSNKIALLQARTNPILEAIGGVALGLITLYCGWLTLSGAQQPGVFVSFSAALLLAYEPAKRLARLRVNLEMSLVGLRMLYELLDTPPSVTENDDAPPLVFGNGTIEFRNVEFGYRPNTPVLKNINHKILRNSKVALVGPSGAGKTTILSLIPRLYDISRGEILIDGQDIRAVSSSSLRRQIAVVSQDTYLFGGSIRENIRIGRPDVSADDVRAAATDALADEFISALPAGYDTDVGENGVQLSGGQRQRIAIARAILKGAPILLLDEATSSLDSQSEKVVQLALDRLMQGRTTIVVAHRLSTILNADRIFVIDEGTIVQEGTHRELLARGGLYASLYEHQFANLPRELLVVEGESEARALPA
jgi:ATP-binding cassette subfamily B protein